MYTSLTRPEIPNIVSRIYCENKTNSKNHLISSNIVLIVPDNHPCLRSRLPNHQQISEQNADAVDLFTDASLVYSSQLSICIFYKHQNFSSITGGAILFLNRIVNKCITIPIPVTSILYT